ncbi:MAG TPA: DsbA family protein [Acidimicrobiales bacterium]|nr:DsbA family protein [Acidimicrobiales bacterium]
MPPSGATGRRRFAVTWDYRGRFARHLSDCVVAGLVDGAEWEVEFRPFSVEQTRRADGQAPIWDDPGTSVSFLAMQVGLIVRDRFPEHFLPVHAALFAARHDEGLDLGQEDVLRQVLVRNGVDPDTVFDELASGAAVETYRREHERSVAEHGVFGVPTLLAGGRAAFVRLMQGPGDDPGAARRTVDRLLDLVVGWPELNELKHTTIPGSTR